MSAHTCDGVACLLQLRIRQLSLDNMIADTDSPVLLASEPSAIASSLTHEGEHLLHVRLHGAPLRGVLPRQLLEPEQSDRDYREAQAQQGSARSVWLWPKQHVASQTSGAGRSRPRPSDFELGVRQPAGHESRLSH